MKTSAFTTFLVLTALTVLPIIAKSDENISNNKVVRTVREMIPTDQITFSGHSGGDECSVQLIKTVEGFAAYAEKDGKSKIFYEVSAASVATRSIVTSDFVHGIFLIKDELGKFKSAIVISRKNGLATSITIYKDRESGPYLTVTCWLEPKTPSAE